MAIKEKCTCTFQLSTAGVSLLQLQSKCTKPDPLISVIYIYIDED